MHIIIFINIYTQLFTYIRIRYSRMIQIMIYVYTFMANYHIINIYTLLYNIVIVFFAPPLFFVSQCCTP